MNMYEYPSFRNPARVRIALAGKNATAQVELVTVDVPAGKHRQPALPANNPSGTIPLLEPNGGTLISARTAIAEYIDHAFDGPSLTGATPPPQRAVVPITQRRAGTELLDAVGG